MYGEHPYGGAPYGGIIIINTGTISSIKLDLQNSNIVISTEDSLEPIQIELDLRNSED